MTDLIASYLLRDKFARLAIAVLIKEYRKYPELLAQRIKEYVLDLMPIADVPLAELIVNYALDSVQWETLTSRLMEELTNA